jgi:hypothetical protein
MRLAVLGFVLCMSVVSAFALGPGLRRRVLEFRRELRRQAQSRTLTPQQLKARFEALQKDLLAAGDAQALDSLSTAKQEVALLESGKNLPPVDEEPAAAAPPAFGDAKEAASPDAAAEVFDASKFAPADPEAVPSQSKPFVVNLGAYLDLKDESAAREHLRAHAERLLEDAGLGDRDGARARRLATRLHTRLSAHPLRGKFESLAFAHHQHRLRLVYTLAGGRAGSQDLGPLALWTEDSPETGKNVLRGNASGGGAGGAKGGKGANAGGDEGGGGGGAGRGGSGNRPAKKPGMPGGFGSSSGRGGTAAGGFSPRGAASLSSPRLAKGDSTFEASGANGGGSGGFNPARTALAVKAPATAPARADKKIPTSATLPAVADFSPMKKSEKSKSGDAGVASKSLDGKTAAKEGDGRGKGRAAGGDSVGGFAGGGKAAKSEKPLKAESAQPVARSPVATAGPGANPAGESLAASAAVAREQEASWRDAVADAPSSGVGTRIDLRETLRRAEREPAPRPSAPLGLACVGAIALTAAAALRSNATKRGTRR